MSDKFSFKDLSKFHDLAILAIFVGYFGSFLKKCQFLISVTIMKSIFIVRVILDYNPKGDRLVMAKFV